MATWILFGKLFGVTTLVGFGKKRCRKDLPLSAPSMTELLRWPADFDDPTPVTDFDSALTAYFHSLIETGIDVHAHRTWMFFTMSRESRMVDFIRRGRLRLGNPMCWEVRLIHDGKSMQLGPLFGIRGYACVVIAGIDDVRTVTERWLAGNTIESLLDGVTYWDRTDASKPLEPVS